ncbi:16S rRNA (uracil(1498)-N(3))-methyltransferase [Haliscomenobacter sp.]|uniref:16S rRNA (uracil(1498)-N(3))-methyltransferase n=1 Tax=Haliscomenobacter sp. TaxID=2717303 RepID=UPI003BAD0372
MNIFFASNIVGDLLEFDEEEIRHLLVLRYSRLDQIQVVDGKGNWYVAELVDLGKKRAVAKVIERTSSSQRKPYHLHLAIAPTKNIDRLEWFLEKATEIGVDEITPILCRNSERTQVRLDRLEKILLSAMKQSLKVFLPKLNPLTPLKTFIQEQENFAGQKCIAWISDPPGKLLQQTYIPAQNVIVVIGPEGDFSPDEIELAQQHNFVPVSLGQSRLRTETAGVVAVHTIELMNGYLP